MKTVKSIIRDVYDSPSAAADRLGVVRSAVSAWSRRGNFPPRLQSVIARHAKEAGKDIDLAEIPIISADRRVA